MSTILTIIPYSFYPPKGGGALRCFYLLREMSFRHTVYLLTIQQEKDFETNSLSGFPKNVKVISIYKFPKYRSVFNFLPSKIADAINFRILKRTAKESTDTSLLQIYPALDSLLQKVNFDVIFYENLEAVSLLANIINRKSPASIKVYDAHNVDSELWMQKSNSENIVLYREYAKKALLTEKSLFKKADIFFSCSQRDNEKLVKINNGKIRGTVIPNGVDTELNPFDTNPTKHLIKNIIFCGSLGYFPNKEGLRWFYTNVFPLIIEKFPSVTLTVIGNVTDKADYAFLQNDEAVNFVGKVESVIPYYKNASVSIVPLKSGSGTRLKILEAMSLGNPVVSSSIGAEGIEYSDNTNILIADEPAAFASQIAFLLQNEKAFNKIRKNGRELVHKVYAWNKIGEQMNKSLEEVFKKKVKL